MYIVYHLLQLQLQVPTKYKTRNYRDNQSNLGGNLLKSMHVSVENSLQSCRRTTSTSSIVLVGLHYLRGRSHAWTQQPRHIGQGSLPRCLRHPGLGCRQGQRLRSGQRPPSFLCVPRKMERRVQRPRKRDNSHVQRSRNGDCSLGTARRGQVQVCGGA